MKTSLDLVYIANKYQQVAELLSSYDAACTRAEAAEARAAQLEAERDEAVQKGQTIAKWLAQTTKERDELRNKLNDAMRISRGFVAERDEALRKLEQAQKAYNELSGAIDELQFKGTVDGLGRVADVRRKYEAQS